MAIEDSDPLMVKFAQSFPKFNGGKRELRYIAGKFWIDVDTYQNTEHQIKLQIADKMSCIERVDHMKTISNYLAESKVNIEAFEFIDDSPSQKWLIDQEINQLFIMLKIDNQLVSWLNSLSFRIKDKFIFIMDGWNLNSMEKEKAIIRITERISQITRDMEFLSWFKDDVEKIVAADDFFKKNDIVFYRQLNNVEDVRIYFYANRERKDFLKLAFQKIRVLHNNRKSRKNTHIKQCNFSLSLAADKNINKLANEYRLSRSDVVDLFFKNIKNLRDFDGVNASFDVRSYLDKFKRP